MVTVASLKHILGFICAVVFTNLPNHVKTKSYKSYGKKKVCKEVDIYQEIKKKKTLQSAFSHECIITLGKNQSKHCSDETSAATVNIIL